jgi:hypothetical protein
MWEKIRAIQRSASAAAKQLRRLKEVNDSK